MKPSLLIRGLVLFSMACGMPVVAEQLPDRGIVRITGDLYRFQENAHYGVFLVTSDGVIVVDQINAETATWLKTQLQQRFQKEVKYLVYSHHHEDHVSGGEVFAATATIIAHDNAVAGLNVLKIPTPLPDITFSDSMTLVLGQSVVELSYAGISHSNDSLIVHFPAQRAIYAADFVLAKALPFQDIPLWAYHYPEWLASLHNLESMDFDILIPAHDQIGTHKDVRLFRHYMEDLESAVRDAIDAGLSVEEMQQTISLDEYKDWALYDAWFALNVKGMYQQLMRPAVSVMP